MPTQTLLCVCVYTSRNMAHRPTNFPFVIQFFELDIKYTFYIATSNLLILFSNGRLFHAVIIKSNNEFMLFAF